VAALLLFLYLGTDLHETTLIKGLQMIDTAEINRCNRKKNNNPMEYAHVYVGVTRKECFVAERNKWTNITPQRELPF
jgi:hypothetical protein